VKTEEAEPEVIASSEYEHNTVALFDAEVFEIVCGFVGIKHHITEGKTLFLAVFSHPYHCKLIGLGFAKLVENIICKVEVLLEGEIVIVLCVF
jgi:transcription antitermination factor NusA-like protein